MFYIISSIIYSVLIILLITTSIKFTKKLNYPQIKIRKIVKSINKNQLSTLFLTLAGRIGVGSIAGVAIAIIIGKEGTIFWMWVIGILGASLTYCETILGQKYKKNNKGGPKYYIENKTLKKTYSVIIIITYILGFIPIQSNTIIKTMPKINNKITVGILLSILTYVLIKKGLKRINKVVNIIVPIMSIIYLSASAYIILNNISKTTIIIKQIIEKALNIKALTASFLPALIIGIQKGIFSGEIGIGTSSISSSTSKENPIKIAYCQILSVYITSLLICTATALIILISNQNINITNPNGIEIVTKIFERNYHSIGFIIIFISIFLFAFSTIITGYYYCEANITQPKIIKIIIPISVFIGCIISPNIIWKTIDLFVAIMGIINIYSINKKEKEIIEYQKKYETKTFKK